MIPAREPQENVRSEDDTVVQQRVRYFGDYERLNEIARGGMGVVPHGPADQLGKFLDCLLTGQRRQR